LSTIEPNENKARRRKPRGMSHAVQSTGLSPASVLRGRALNQQ